MKGEIHALLDREQRFEELLAEADQLYMTERQQLAAQENDLRGEIAALRGHLEGETARREQARPRPCSRRP